LFDESQRKGLEFLLIVMADEELPLLYREEGEGLLQKSIDTTFGYNPEVEAEANAAAIARI
jgi:hypothetical protein